MSTKKYLYGIVTIGSLIALAGVCGFDSALSFIAADALLEVVRDAKDDAELRQALTEYLLQTAPARMALKVLVGGSLVVLGMLCLRELRRKQQETK